MDGKVQCTVLDSLLIESIPSWIIPPCHWNSVGSDVYQLLFLMLLPHHVLVRTTMFCELTSAKCSTSDLSNKLPSVVNVQVPHKRKENISSEHKSQ